MFGLREVTEPCKSQDTKYSYGNTPLSTLLSSFTLVLCLIFLLQIRTPSWPIARGKSSSEAIMSHHSDGFCGLEKNVGPLKGPWDPPDGQVLSPLLSSQPLSQSGEVDR